MSILDLKKDVKLEEKDKNIKVEYVKDPEPEFNFSDLFVEPEESGFLVSILPWLNLVILFVILIVVIIKH